MKPIIYQAGADNILSDTYSVSGKTFEGFKKAVKEFSGATDFKVVHGKNITFLSKCDIEEYQKKDMETYYVFNETYVDSFLSGSKLKIGHFKTEDFPSYVLNEVEDTTQLILVTDNEKYAVSKIAIPTLCKTLQIQGRRFGNRNNMIRNLNIADACFAKDDSGVPNQSGILYRRDPETGARKIFAFFSTKTKGLDMSSSIAFLEKQREFGAVIKNWKITQYETTVRAEFPEISDELTKKYDLPEPYFVGFEFTNSDVGKSGFGYRRYIRIGKNLIYQGEVLLKHSSHLEQRLEEFNQNPAIDIKLAEDFFRLASDLQDKQVEDDDSSNPDDRMRLYASTVQNGMRPITGIIPKKWYEASVEHITSKIDPKTKYSKYDLFRLMLEIPTVLKDLDDVDRREACNALSRVPEIL